MHHFQILLFIRFILLLENNEIVLYFLYISFKSRSWGWRRDKRVNILKEKLFLESMTRRPRIFGSDKSGVKTIYENHLPTVCPNRRISPEGKLDPIQFK